MLVSRLTACQTVDMLLSLLLLLPGCKVAQTDITLADPSTGETARPDSEEGPSDTAAVDSSTGETARPDSGSTDCTAAPDVGPLVLADPVDGDGWASGSMHWVTWTYSSVCAGPDDKTPTVTIELSLDGGKSWETAQGNYRNGADVPSPYDEEQAFAWVMSKVDATALVRIRDQDDPDIEDVAAVSLLASQAMSYQWELITPRAAFAARDGAGALTHGGKMWLLGGWNPANPENFPLITNSEVWSSADGLSWTEEVAQAPWEGRHLAGYAVFLDQLWILGGDVNQGHYQPDAWRSSDGITWVEAVSELPWGHRSLHHTAVLGDRVLVMGGQTFPDNDPAVTETILYNDVWASEDGVNWARLLEEAPWSPRGMIGGSAVLDDRIWLLGGGTYDTSDHLERDYYNDVWSSADGVSWTRHVVHTPWSARQFHDVAAWDDRIWVLEGYDGDTNLRDAWYSSDGENWYEVSGSPWDARHAASVFVHEGHLWLVAGNNLTPDVWRLSRL